MRTKASIHAAESQKHNLAVIDGSEARYLMPSVLYFAGNLQVETQQLQQ